MELNKLKLTSECLFGASGKAYIVGIRESHPYIEGKVQASVIDGYKVEAVAIDNGFERVIVTISKKPSLSQEQIDNAEEPIMVTFQNFTAKLYRDYKNNSWNISCKADSIEVQEFI